MIRIANGLPYTRVILKHHGQERLLDHVLVDTGSGGTIFSTDILLSLGIHYDMQDEIHRIRGVGGAEFVFSKTVEQIAIEGVVLNNVQIEVGGLDYGLPLDGILGMDVLLRMPAVIDLAQCSLSQGYVRT